MSFSTPEVKNPCNRFYEFKSDDKAFVRFDKENKKNIPVELPAYLVVLDNLHCVTGYSKSNNCGFYSNEVKNLKNEKLNVKTFKGSYSETGLWDDIKGTVKGAGGKYTRSMYVLLIQKGKETEMANFKFTGSALNALIDFEKTGFNSQSSMIRIENEFKEEKNGKTTYNVPVFKSYELSDEDIIALATQKDKELQAFLSEYFKQNEQE